MSDPLQADPSLADPSLADSRCRVWRPGDDLAPLRRAVAEGRVLIIPTESSYGLAVDPRNAAGVEAIYRLKARDRGKPLPVVAADRRQILDLGVEPQAFGLDIACRLWPAPLTVVLPLAAPIAATAGHATLAVRIPSHGPLRQLLADLGCPLTATSANLSGQPAIVEPCNLESLMESPNTLLIDGGPLAGGEPSTLLRPVIGGLEVLRPGPFDVQRWHRAAAAAAPTTGAL